MNNGFARHYGRNFALLTLEGVFLGFLTTTLSPYLSLPFYLSKLTANKILLGLIPAINVLGMYFPQLFVSGYVQSLPKKRLYVLRLVFVQKICLLLLSILCFYQQYLSTGMVIFLFFLLYSVNAFSTGILIPAWVEFVAKAIPEKRSLFFGLFNLLVAVSGIANGYLMKYLIKIFPYPYNFQYIFLFGFILSAGTLLTITFYREGEYPVHEYGNRFLNHYRKMFRFIKEHREFMKFIIFRTVFTFGEIASPFYIIYALKKFTLADKSVGIFTILVMAAQTVFFIVWGLVGHYYGNIRVFRWSSLAGILLGLAALFAVNVWQFYAVFILMGIMMSSYMVADSNTVIDFAPHEETPLFVGFMNTSLSGFMTLTPLLGGFIIDVTLDYRYVFALTSVFFLASHILVRFIKDQPGASPAAIGKDTD